MRYEVDPQLLADLTRLAIRDEYPKVVAVTVEILTGLAPQIASRRVHRLRAGRGGNNPGLRSAAGTAILRADIQTNSPAAQRIHWTTTPDGTIRMLSVTLHDEYLPQPDPTPRRSHP